MRAVTAIFLAALTGLSSLAACAGAVGPAAVTLFFELSEKFPDKPFLWISIPIGLVAAMLFLGFAWLCWWLANAVWPNRMFAG